MSEWQPIETAPRDKLVIVFLPWGHEHGQVRPARFNTFRPGQKGWKVYYSARHETPILGEPTHWMPLPEPPK